MYMRESVAVMATNRLSVRMVGKCPSEMGLAQTHFVTAEWG